MRVRPGSEVLAGGTVHPAGAPPCEPAPQPVFASRPVEIPGSWWYLGDIPHGWAAAELIMLVRDLLFHLCRLGPVSAAVADGGPVLIDGADVHLLAGTTSIWIIGGVTAVSSTSAPQAVVPAQGCRPAGSSLAWFPLARCAPPDRHRRRRPPRPPLRPR
jgi:hypothetical protein